MNVKIVKTGVANVASVSAAFSRLGCETALTESGCCHDGRCLGASWRRQFWCGMKASGTEGWWMHCALGLPRAGPRWPSAWAYSPPTSEESPMSADSDVFLWRSAHSQTVARPHPMDRLANENAPVLGEVRVLRQLLSADRRADGLAGV